MANEPFRLSPFVFEEQDAAKFRKTVRAILERAADCFPVGDRERNDVAFIGGGVFEGFGSLVEPFQAEAPRKLHYETFRDLESCQQHSLWILRPLIRARN